MHPLAGAGGHCKLPLTDLLLETVQECIGGLGYMLTLPCTWTANSANITAAILDYVNESAIQSSCKLLETSFISWGSNFHGFRGSAYQRKLKCHET